VWRYVAHLAIVKPHVRAGLAVLVLAILAGAAPRYALIDIKLIFLT
jgi:hypothetical protein